jgi:hypothetical protein
LQRLVDRQLAGLVSSVELCARLEMDDFDAENFLAAMAKAISFDVYDEVVIAWVKSAQLAFPFVLKC